MDINAPPTPTSPHSVVVVTDDTTTTTTTTSSLDQSRPSSLLPSLISDAIVTLRWPLDRPAACRPMELLPLHELDDPVLPTLGEIDVLELVALLRMSSSSSSSSSGPAAGTTTCSTSSNNNRPSSPVTDGTAVIGDHQQEGEEVNRNSHEHWAWIATALILLGHGYIDHAHDLIGPLCFHTDLPYFHGPIQGTDMDVLAAASYVHTLIHRREGPHPSEYGQTGYINAGFWAGATLRSGGESTLPLMEIRSQIQHLANLGGEQPQRWFNTNHNDGSFQEYWDPRPLTSLCEMVYIPGGNAPTNHHQTRHRQHHPLMEFAQQAALIELQVLLQHSLTKLGYVCNTTRLMMSSSSSSSSVGTTTTTRMLFEPDPAYSMKLPKTIDEIRFAPQFQDKCIVVTTATSPHRIVFANKAWSTMCGHSLDGVIGHTLEILQGPESNTAVASLVAKQCRDTLTAQEVYLVNYTSDGERFVNHVTMAPLHHHHHHQQAKSASSTTVPSNSSYPQYMVAILRRMEYRDRISPAA